MGKTAKQAEIKRHSARMPDQGSPKLLLPSKSRKVCVCLEGGGGNVGGWGLIGWAWRDFRVMKLPCTLLLFGGYMPPYTV